MTRTKQCLAAGIPAIGLCVLVVWSSILPFVDCFPDFPGAVSAQFWNMLFIQIFGIPMAVWCPVAFISYAFGFWAFRGYLKTQLVELFIVSEVVMFVPVAICVLLFTVREYRGP